MYVFGEKAGICDILPDLVVYLNCSQENMDITLSV